jgi:hypothetical protein
MIAPLAPLFPRTVGLLDPRLSRIIYLKLDALNGRKRSAAEEDVV